MVPSAVRNVLSQHEALFPDGPLALLAMNFAHPLAVYLPEGLRIEHTVADTIAALGRQQAVAREAGMRSVRHTILTATQVRPGRFTVLVQWDFLNLDQSCIADNWVRYFLSRQADGAYLIEMVEYIRRAFPDVPPMVMAGPVA